MSVLKSNRIENVAGTHGFDVKDVIPDVKDSAWSGTTLADEQALRDFYGDQSITVQGANFSAKSYPDGSVVGSTDNGEFEMRANGRLECSGETAPLTASGTMGADAFQNSIVIDFVSIFKTKPVLVTTLDRITGTVWGSGAYDVTTSNAGVRIMSMHQGDSGTILWLAKGTWK